MNGIHLILICKAGEFGDVGLLVIVFLFLVFIFFGNQKQEYETRKKVRAHSVSLPVSSF